MSFTFPFLRTEAQLAQSFLTADRTFMPLICIWLAGDLVVMVVGHRADLEKRERDERESSDRLLDHMTLFPVVLYFSVLYCTVPYRSVLHQQQEARHPRP